MFFELDRYPFLELLRPHLPEFQSEARRVIESYHYLMFRYGLFQGRARGYLEGSRASFCWQIYGKRVARNCQVCPQTSATVLSCVPNCVTSGFYLLGPHSRILPHVGVSDQVRRAHMGIFCPPQCGLRVVDQVRHWEDGGFLVFDDTFEHEVWNDSDELRCIMLFDFVREDLPVAEHARFLSDLRQKLMTGADYGTLLQAGLDMGSEECPVAPVPRSHASPAHLPEVIAEHGLFFL